MMSLQSCKVTIPNIEAGKTLCVVAWDLRLISSKQQTFRGEDCSEAASACLSKPDSEQLCCQGFTALFP